MNARFLIVVCSVLTLAACGQPAPAPAPAEPVAEIAAPETAAHEFAEVDAETLAAPNEAFVAIEPSEIGVFGAPTVEEAIDPIVGAPEAHEEGATVSVSVRQSGETMIADIVRANIPDDSVAAGHVRIEFRREPEGWFPTNAYRRTQCRRGDAPGQWSTGLCP